MDNLNITLVNLWPEGGMLHYTAQLSTALSKQDNLTVTVVLPEGADSRLFSTDVRLHHVDIPVHVTLLNLLKFATGISFIKLYRAIVATRPDVVHFNSSHPLLLTTLPFLARKFKIVATIHDATSHPGSDKNLRKHLERQIVVRYAQYFFMHRDIIREQFLKLNPTVDRSQVVITPHGDFDFFNDTDNTAPEEASTILFFGRISVYKGLIHLVEAIDLIKSKHPDLRVIIAGNGDPGPEVTQAIQYPHYEVHNRFINDDEIAPFFNRATILVLPYIEASESGVIQIGKAFNKPIISTHVGGIPEAVADGKTGIIVAPENTQELANAIDTLLSDKTLQDTFIKNIQIENKTRPGWKEASSTIAHIYKSVANFDQS